MFEAYTYTSLIQRLAALCMSYYACTDDVLLNCLAYFCVHREHLKHLESLRGTPDGCLHARFLGNAYPEKFFGAYCASATPTPRSTEEEILESLRVKGVLR